MKKIYINGEFITLENETCEAILIEDKIISKVRMKKDILKYADDNTEIIDLKGKTMMPAFIDAHSHFFGVANNFLQISLENCTNIDEIQSKYYWGDTHIKNFGLDRASKISPAKSTLKNNILFTFHQDSPVIEPNMFETIWCAVKRKTKKGILLGKEEQISVLEAIKAVTINAAYQYFEENTKGSIKEGKFADLIIVDKNPLRVKIDEIKDIKILETIKKGVVNYKM